jgi:serine protease Do
VFDALRKIGSLFVWLYLIFGVVLPFVFGLLGDGYEDTMPEEPGTEGFIPAPEAPSPEGEVDADGERGPILPAPSPFDDQSMVEAARAKNWTTGTGFAIAGQSYWLTAKHVANGCDRLGLVNEESGVAVKARVVYIAQSADVAILQTDGGPTPLALDLDESDIKIGSRAFHVGYPQSKPGEVRSRLIGRELMVTKGAWRGRENTLAWAETARTRGLVGTLGGLSGGPAFDAKGNVIGITVAENPRRGRIITTDATSIIAALSEAGITPNGVSQRALTPSNFTAEAKRLRASLKVIQVICMVN